MNFEKPQFYSDTLMELYKGNWLNYYFNESVFIKGTFVQVWEHKSENHTFT